MQIVGDLFHRRTNEEMKNQKIDCGKNFDWGRISNDYAKYRDIYPELFYQKIAERNLCIKNQKILDLGTGTGVLTRNMYYLGGDWTGIDISENQILQARKLSLEAGQRIQYILGAAEDIAFPESSFDVVTACQCFFYFEEERLIPKLAHILKDNGRFLLLYMAWLPYEDKIAGESERLVGKYNPNWSGGGERMRPILVPDCMFHEFEAVYHEEYEMDISFTRETWNGRMKACRGIGASLSPEEIEYWEKEHINLLEKIAPEKFTIKHYGAMLELRRKERIYEGS